MGQDASTGGSWTTVQVDLLNGGWMLMGGAVVVLLCYVLFVGTSLLLAGARRVASGHAFGRELSDERWFGEREA
ncbi:MAG TPA: hypothetical protein VJ976_07720 [Ornithinimicrobium sp.]|uniref:hypothetical protein n=1 Tax=Ornithinimicrobium sp. TaxID=1977084 RepID=UPI002B475A24|nr:hypothetical protein [Ornithinimicrobium sp.]HKJ12265.1 hypothetical protein [Ornithinimicrobium sp.]